MGRPREGNDITDIAIAIGHPTVEEMDTLVNWARSGKYDAEFLGYLAGQLPVTGDQAANNLIETLRGIVPDRISSDAFSTFCIATIPLC
jgi:hypothetical protein